MGGGRGGNKRCFQWQRGVGWGGVSRGFEPMGVSIEITVKVSVQPNRNELGTSRRRKAQAHKAIMAQAQYFTSLHQVIQASFVEIKKKQLNSPACI